MEVPYQWERFAQMSNLFVKISTKAGIRFTLHELFDSFFGSLSQLLSRYSEVTAQQRWTRTRHKQCGSQLFPIARQIDVYHREAMCLHLGHLKLFNCTYSPLLSNFQPH